jgi:hypothetical protein
MPETGRLPRRHPKQLARAAHRKHRSATHAMGYVEGSKQPCTRREKTAVRRATTMERTAEMPRRAWRARAARQGTRTPLNGIERGAIIRDP